MSFSRYLITSTVLAGVVFSVSTLPLAASGTKLVRVQMDDESVFVGQLKELAGPYLGLSAAISLGAGAIGLTMMGWRQSSRKLNQAEDEMSAIKQQLLEKEAQIESLTFSPAKLEAAGLDAFLQGDAEEDVYHLPSESAAPAQEKLAVNSHNLSSSIAVVIDSLVEMAQPAANTTVSKAAMNSVAKLQATSALPGAQAFMGYARPKAETTPAHPIVEPSSPQESENSPQLDELLTYLKQVMTQIEKLHPAQNGTIQNPEILSTELSAA